MTGLEKHLASTYTIDCAEPSIKKKAAELTKGRQTEIDKAKAVFYFVRDQIKYNPKGGIAPLEQYKASATLKRGDGYCVQKAVLLAALAREDYRAGLRPRRGCAAAMSPTSWRQKVSRSEPPAYPRSQRKHPKPIRMSLRW